MLLSRSFKVAVPLNPGKLTSNYTTCKNTGFVCMQVEFIHKLWNTCHRIFWIPELHKVKQNLANQLKIKIFKDYCTKKQAVFQGASLQGAGRLYERKYHCAFVLFLCSPHQLLVTVRNKIKGWMDLWSDSGLVLSPKLLSWNKDSLESCFWIRTFIYKSGFTLIEKVYQCK